MKEQGEGGESITAEHRGDKGEGSIPQHQGENMFTKILHVLEWNASPWVPAWWRQQIGSRGCCPCKKQCRGDGISNDLGDDWLVFTHGQWVLRESVREQVLGLSPVEVSLPDLLSMSFITISGLLLREHTPVCR